MFVKNLVTKSLFSNNVLAFFSTKSQAQQSRLVKNRLVEIIGVATKLGQQKDGPNLGPQALRGDTNLYEHIQSLDWQYHDHGDITIESLDQREVTYDPSRKFLHINNSELMGQMSHVLSQKTYNAVKNGNFPLVLGGDHGLATGSISGVLDHYPDLKIVWVDAHADINTPEISPSGNYHGMPMAHLIGLIKKGSVKGFDWLTPRFDPKNLVYIGLRDIDNNEKDILKNLNIKTYTMYEVTEIGIAQVMKETLEHIGMNSPIHLSFDIDSLDPFYAPGTGTLCRGGLNFREAQYLVRKLYNTGNLVSMDLAELNPLMDIQKQNFHGDQDTKHNIGITAYLGLELIMSALGNKYL